MNEAKYYYTDPENIVHCILCPQLCIIEENTTGLCRGRINFKGKLVANNYGEVAAINIDPIEKKPLYHYFPGSKILSLGANSCNMHCSFCQNYEISQYESDTTPLSPEHLLLLCQKEKCYQVAFTYTEPFTWFEYVMDCAILLKDNGIRTVLVTNGYVNEQPLQEIIPYIDAMNIDLKSMDSDFYTNICGGSLDPVLKTIKKAFQSCHLELTFLLIPGLNDSDDTITRLTEFISSLSSDIPLHISKYFPRSNISKPATSLSALHKAANIAKSKLNYVYLGNISESGYSDTICPNCGNLIITRTLYISNVIGLSGQACSQCGKKTYGKF